MARPKKGRARIQQGEDGESIVQNLNEFMKLREKVLNELWTEAQKIRDLYKKGSVSLEDTLVTIVSLAH